MASLMKKLRKLEDILRRMRSAVVAYSGGVDSSFLLRVAQEALPDKVLAVTGASPTYTPDELAQAKKTAAAIGAKHLVVRTQEFKDRRFTLNPADRCYYCKRELLGRLKSIARAKGFAQVIEASTVSDKGDLRPGTRAVDELGVRSPLQEAGFTKAEVRRASKLLGLPTWDKPSQACLASRIPYGMRITPVILERVRKAEAYLRKEGFAQVRVRHYQGLCRIEVETKLLPKLLGRRQQVARRLKQLGYQYVTIDLEGYRTGSMNSGGSLLWKKYT